MSNAYRALPSVNDVLAAAESLRQSQSHALTVEAVRAELDDLRRRIGMGESLDGAIAAGTVAVAAASRIKRADSSRLRPVINATGILLHTNLGRAPMAESAAQSAAESARHYVNLEFDLEVGERSTRTQSIQSWLCRLTGAEAATAVNNCAAATVLVLRAMAAGREAIVSRGQLVEIGGSFRIPEIMAVSGAILREVGTTNITRIGDYERAIGPTTALLLRIHQSNFRIHGFTAMPALSALVELGEQRGIPVVDDIGSGALIDFQRFGLPGEPIARDSILTGADLVLFSGDKLLGGPQAGIIVGRRKWVEQIERDPLMRAVRLDKMALAALEATLRLYADEDHAISTVPLLYQLSLPIAELRRRAHELANRLSGIPGLHCAVRDDHGYVGGGSLPDHAIPSVVVAVRPSMMSETELARRLRIGTPAVVGRIQAEELILDMRTILDDQSGPLVTAMKKAVTE